MKKKIISLLLVIAVLLGSGAVVRALEIKENHTNFLADEDLVVDKSVQGSLFAAGNTVKTESEVDGISFVAGNKVTISSIQDYLFAAGNDITIDKANIKDAYVAGSFITVLPSTIRDIYAAASKININSDIGRDAYLAGEKVYINSTIYGDVFISADKIELGEKAEIVGKIKYPETAKIEKDSLAKINETETYKTKDYEVKISPVKLVVAFILAQVYSYASILLVAFAMIFLFKKTFADIKKMKKDISVLKTGLIGLVSLIVIPIASIIIMITIIGIPLGIISLMLYALMIFLAIIPSTYYIGNWLLGKKIKNDYLMITLALLIYYVVKLIPIIGGLFELAMLLVGIGCFMTVIKNNLTKTK